MQSEVTRFTHDDREILIGRLGVGSHRVPACVIHGVVSIVHPAAWLNQELLVGELGRRCGTPNANGEETDTRTQTGE